MQTFFTVIHVLLALALIGLVLLQQGRGADAGAAFGTGASATVFGARGSANFLTRATALVAAAFFITSIVLAYYATQAAQSKGLMDKAAPAEQRAVEAPANSDLPAVAVPAVLPEAPAGGPASGKVTPSEQVKPSADAMAQPGAAEARVPEGAADAVSVVAEGGKTTESAAVSANNVAPVPAANDAKVVDGGVRPAVEAANNEREAPIAPAHDHTQTESD